MKEEYDYIVNAFTMENEKTNLEVDNLNVGCITSKNNNFELDKEGNLTVKSIKTTKYIPLNNEVLDTVYPVGSIYMSVNNANPKELFGGVWEQITGRFLLGSGSPKQNEYSGFGMIQEDQFEWNFTTNTTGGEYNHKLTIAEMPSHNHHLGNGVPQALTAGNSFYHQTSNSYLGPIFQTGVNGGDSRHNNIPPYLAVNIWKRVS